jgi:hypothetical protein
MKIKETEKIKILKEKFAFVINHFSNERYNLIFRFFKQFYASNKGLLKEKQFAQCTLQNRVLVNLLIQSGRFKKRDIIKKWTPFWGIHQHLIISTGNKKFMVDPFYKKLKEK